MKTDNDKAVRAERMRRYDRIRRESSVQALQLAANRAAEDAQALIAAGQIATAAGAVTEMVRSMLLRSLAPSGSEGVAAARDLDTKRSLIAKFEEIGLPIAAVMVAAAVAYEEAVLSRPVGSTQH